MSGLASKWATEEELVNKAKSQDSGSSKHVAHKQSSTTEKPKPLTSKWADDSSEPGNTSTYKDNPKRLDVSSKYSRSGKKNNGKDDRNSRRQTYSSLPSPPSTAENDESVSRSSHTSRAGSGNIPRGPRASNTYANNKQHKHHANKNKNFGNAEESDRDKKVPMSKEGASLAARLDIRCKATAVNSNKNKDDNGFDSTDEEVTDEDAEENEDLEDSEDDREDLPPMTSAGQSLASRLGVVSISDSKPDPPRTKPNTNQPQQQQQQQQQPRQNQSTPRPARSSKGTYQTPRQKWEEQAKKEEAEKEKLQNQRDAKLKEEVRDMFSKLTNSSANWADLEDED